MNLIMKIEKIMPKYIEVFVAKIDENDKRFRTKLQYFPQLYDTLFKHLGELILIEMKDGTVIKFLKKAPENILMRNIDLVDWKHQILYVLKHDRMTKEKFYEEYMELTGVSLRTAQRRVKQLIEEELITEPDHYHIEGRKA